jgi:bifunctional non-homologous end joining protein LigD
MTVLPTPLKDRFVRPCLPRHAQEPPAGPGWIHEIKHDGFRILAQKDGDQVKLITRNGYDFADRYCLIVDAIANLPVKSCIIDGEAIVVDQNGTDIAGMTMQLPCAPSTLSN